MSAGGVCAVCSVCSPGAHIGKLLWSGPPTPSGNSARSCVIRGGYTYTTLDAPRFKLKRLAWGRRPALQVTADATGRAWLFAGADSGFEGTTTLYLVRAKARLVRVD